MLAMILRASVSLEKLQAVVAGCSYLHLSKGYISYSLFMIHPYYRIALAMPECRKARVPRNYVQHNRGQPCRV